VRQPQAGAIQLALPGGREATRVPTATTANVGSWHTASNRCGAKVRTRSERMDSIGSRDIRLHLAIGKPLERFLTLVGS
jgi:hypothetical protein